MLNDSYDGMSRSRRPRRTGEEICRQHKHRQFLEDLQDLGNRHKRKESSTV